MKPTVGRVVLFHSVDGPTHAAIIAYVHSATLVNLAVFDQNGVPYNRTSVTLIQRAETPPEFSMWCEWPMPVDLPRTVAQLPVVDTPPTAVTDAAVEPQIQAKGLTAPRVTPQMIQALMARVQYSVGEGPKGTTTTFVHAYLDGNFYLATGMSACVSAANFDAEIGDRIARADAIQKTKDRLWELEGYRLFASMTVH